MSKKYMKSKTQVSLNWVLSHENVITIPKSRNPIHLMEFMDSTGWEMDLVDKTELTNSFI